MSERADPVPSATHSVHLAVAVVQGPANEAAGTKMADARNARARRTGIFLQRAVGADEAGVRTTEAARGALLLHGRQPSEHTAYGKGRRKRFARDVHGIDQDCRIELRVRM